MYIYSCSSKTPFVLKNACTATVKHVFYQPPLNNYPLAIQPLGIFQRSELFHTTELPGVSPRRNNYPPRTGRLTTYIYDQKHSLSSIFHKLLKTKHGPHRLLKPNRWIMLVRLSKDEIQLSFRFDIFEGKFFWGKNNYPTIWSEHKVIPGSSQIHHSLNITSRHWYHILGNVYRVFFLFLHGRTY